MATINKRINVSISKGARKILTLLAQRDAVPQATKARHLLEQVLEWEEDAVWDAIARSREKKGGRFLSHNEVWGV